MYFGMTVFSFSEVGYVFFDCVKNSLYCFGVLLFVPVVYLYNGRRSRSDGKNIFMSRLFYVFYPAHMLALYMIKFLVR